MQRPRSASCFLRNGLHAFSRVPTRLQEQRGHVGESLSPVASFTAAATAAVRLTSNPDFSGDRRSSFSSSHLGTCFLGLSRPTHPPGQHHTSLGSEFQLYNSISWSPDYAVWSVQEACTQWLACEFDCQSFRAENNNNNNNNNINYYVCQAPS